MENSFGTSAFRTVRRRNFSKATIIFTGAGHLEYPKLFPNDVNYVIGKSDYRKDWFFEQVPHNEDPGNSTGLGRGSSTTWKVAFDLAHPPHGKATLRLALCGVGTRSIAVNVNNHPLGSVTGLIYNATINRDGIGGYWSERDLVHSTPRR